MNPESNLQGSTGKSSLGGILLAIGLVFAVNLGILGYSIFTATDHSHEESTPSSVAEVDKHSVAPGMESPLVPGTGPAALEDPKLTGQTSAIPLVPPSLAPVVVNPIQIPDSGITQGLYLQHCAACHGLTGRGDGPAANQLYPRPRDFVESPFRFAPKGGGREALIEAIERTIALGVPHSSMPGFQGVLSESDVAGLARYTLNLRAEQAVQSGMETVVDVGTKPPTTSGLIERGAKLYVSLGCVACHGESGHGDGPSSRGLVDSVGRPVRPADLTSGLFKAGQTHEDLVRVILKGIPGTPMAAFEPALATQNPDGSRNLTDAWAVVAYITALSPRQGIIGKGSGAIILIEDALDSAMLMDPASPGWIGVHPEEVELKPIWQREETITHLAIRAVQTEEQIALCLEWEDDTLDAGRDQGVFPDGASVMFAMGDAVPALPMAVHVEGHQAEAPVNLWHWQADRQAAASGQPIESKSLAKGWKLFGHRNESDSATSIVEDSTPILDLPEFVSARDAGSVQAQSQMMSHAALESNAIGFGTLTPQPAEAQDVWGTAAWSGGVWRVVLLRNRKAGNELDAVLDRSAKIPVSFAVWDGSKQDRNGIKLISGWHWLKPSGPDAGSAQATNVQTVQEGN